MVPFTDTSVATECIPTSAAMVSMPAPTIKVAPIADENTDPSSTTNSARPRLQKSTRPAGLNSRVSPVRQRFLRETKMSLMTSSPRTPTGGQKTTARTRGTPSSAKLEIGRDSFYFSMDLPSSKITPKKGTTPKKQSPVRTACSTPTKATAAAKPDPKTRIPTKQTPSPRKNRQSTHQSPNKVLSPTPTKKGRLDAYDDVRPCSPVKRAIELDSPSKPVNLNLGFAGKLVPRPEFELDTHLGGTADVAIEDDYDANAIPTTRPIPNPSEFLAPVRKRRPTVKPQPEDIGQLMAKLGTENTTSTRQEWVSSCTGEVKTSPTSLHKASEKLQIKESLSYLRILSNSAGSAPNVAARIESESTVIISELAEMQQEENEDYFESFLELYTVQKAEIPQHVPLHDSESASQKRQIETRVDSGKQVDCQGTDDVMPEATKAQPLNVSRAAETDPSPILRPQKKPQNLQNTKHYSSRVVSPMFSGPANLAEPPSDPDSHSMTGAQKTRSPCGIGSLKRPKNLHYDSESLPRIMTGSPNRPTLSKMPRAPVMPRRLPARTTPALTQEQSRETAEKPSVQVAVPNKIKGPRTSNSASTTPSIKPARLSASASSTPNKTTSTPKQQASPNTKRTSGRPKSQIPSVNPTNTKIPMASTLNTSSKTASKPIVPAPQHESNLKPPRSILKSTPSSHKLPLLPNCPDTCDASTAPRQQPSLPRPTTALSKRTSLVPVTKGWSKTPIKPTIVAESTTPEGSPPNPADIPPITLAPSPSPSLSPKPLPPLPQRTQSRHAPRYLSPNPSFPIVRRSRASTSPSPSPSLSPSPSIIDEADEADHNAFRTPSKTIIHKLDRAIDAKIAEDALRGLRLLEAREYEHDMF